MPLNVYFCLILIKYMIRNIGFLVALFLVFSCKKEPDTAESIKESVALKIYNYSELEPLLSDKNPQKTYVINFWATWCGPCVKELPYFQELHDTNKDVEVILVSLDFPEKVETGLLPFIKKQKLTPQVILLDDPDENKWLNAIDETWEGELPATLIYNKEKRAFYPKSFSKEELYKEVEKFTKI